MPTRYAHWNNKTVLITGGSSGIGLALGRLLAAQGGHVWLIARRREGLEAALEQVKAAAIRPEQRFGMVSADLSVPEQAFSAVEQVKGAVLSCHPELVEGLSKDQAGVPDVVINSAGAAHPGYVQDLSAEIFRWMMAVNYFGTLYVTKAVLPGMMARRSGHIINISSVAGFIGVFGYTAYGASKFAVAGFSEVLRAEMKRYGIRVSVVFPPDTETPQLDYENQFKPPETKAISGTAKAMKPEQVAQIILRQAAKGRFLIFPALDVQLIYWLNTRLPKSWVFAVLDAMASRGQTK
ncbi:MAG: SDR family oxidoreductase [Chloroflexi bacterium]|nr:SDR family oxidoreductase [Chloroflexota bacterium]